MTSNHQEHWLRIKERLRGELGDDIFSSWFARMELDAIQGDTVKLSVPTRFLKSWIQSNYAEKLLACWQADYAAVSRIELTMSSSVIRNLTPKPKPAEALAHPSNFSEVKSAGGTQRGPTAPVSTAHDALGG